VLVFSAEQGRGLTNRSACGIVSLRRRKPTERSNRGLMVELVEASLCDNPSEKIVVVAEGYNNHDIAEEFRFLKNGREKVGIRFFNDGGLYYPRGATEVLLDALRIHYCATLVVIAVNPLTSFFRAVFGSRNEHETRGLFTLFFHRLFHPKGYMLSPTVNPDIVDILERIEYPEPPVRLFKDVDMPILKSFQVFQRRPNSSGNK
jgi:hypothetical protein